MNDKIIGIIEAFITHLSGHRSRQQVVNLSNNHVTAKFANQAPFVRAQKKKVTNMSLTQNLHLFAGIPVADFPAALVWYEALLGFPPTFFPNDIEAVWELAEHRYLYIEHKPARAGHAMHTIVVADLDAIVARIAERGLDPASRETYENGARKITYRDRDGNEIGFGGGPL